MEQIQTYFKDWSTKLSISVDEIQTEFNKILEEEKKVNTNLTAEEQSNRALKRLSLIYKKQLRSPAIGFEGIVIASEEARDMNARLRIEALGMYKENPQLAISQRVTDEDGTPLDSRKVWKSGKENFGYGKPLQESFVRRIYGVCKKSNSEDIQFFEMNLNGEVSKQTIPLMEPVKFRAIDKSQSSDRFSLGSSTYTKFDVYENDEMDVEKIIRNYFSVLTMPELQKYHDLNKEDYNRIVAVEGDVSVLNLEPTAFGSRIMNLEDLENFDLDAKGMTCWIPPHINVGFAEGSKVIVLGRTTQGYLKDNDGNKTEELGDISMNIFGVYPTDIVKIPKVDSINEI